MIPPPKAGGRPRTTNMRQICNAIFYVLAIPGVTCPMTFPLAQRSIITFVCGEMRG
ncbi:MAG: transposase [Synechococcaceae cyanobacterium SM2_3_2]|nr:transposase [Synechococcaceae cyanobacterium SM2_3_2]